MKYLFLLTVLAFVGLLSSCNSLNLPPAPDVQPQIDSFLNPTATVGRDVMALVADDIAELHDEIEDSDIYLEILNVIVDVQTELDKAVDEDGSLDLGGGVTFPTPDGGVGIDFICDGWNPAQTELDPANGTMKLTMRLVGGSIGALVWGTLDNCRYPVEIGSERLNALYDGDIAVHFGEIVSPSQDLYALPITFISDGTISIGDKDFSIDELVRVTFTLDEEGNPMLDQLDILVQLGDETTFVYSFGTDLGQQIRDASGTFNCSQEDSTCSSPSGTFSW